VRIVVTGGRDYADREHVFRVLDEYPSDTTIIQGGAKGADYLAAIAALNQGKPLFTFVADWAKWGRSAGPRRNEEMLDAGADLVIAFYGGKGTANCVTQARRRGIPIRDERGVFS
jgi:predicted polyphosphate/ATP-dependent NAD kinase